MTQFAYSSSRYTTERKRLKPEIKPPQAPIPQEVSFEEAQRLIQEEGAEVFVDVYLRNDTITAIKKQLVPRGASYNSISLQSRQAFRDGRWKKALLITARLGSGPVASKLRCHYHRKADADGMKGVEVRQLS